MSESSLTRDLVQRLREDQKLAEIFSDRVFAGRVPQGAGRPYILVTTIFSEPMYDLAGESELYRTQLQVDVWADGKSAIIWSKRGGRFVRDSLGPQLNTEILATGRAAAPLYAGGLDVKGATLLQDEALGQAAEDGSDNYLRRQSQDWEFLHTDPIDDGEAPP